MSAIQLTLSHPPSPLDLPYQQLSINITSGDRLIAPEDLKTL